MGFRTRTARARGREALAVACIALMMIVGASDGTARPRPRRVADLVVDRLQRARQARDVARLERLASLDRAARAGARRLAALPRSRRLADDRLLEDDLRAAGVRPFASARSRVELNSGSADPAEAFAGSWASSGSAWSAALDPRRAAVGAAHVRADDGWEIFVAVLIDDPPPPENPDDLRARAVRAVNDERARRGLPRLVVDARLTAVANRHSRDMARRGYFSHRTPDGTTPARRVERAGIAYRTIGENIQRNRGFDDPVRRAVRGWLESAPHRRAMLDPVYSRTGMGVHVAGDGEVFFTQLFLEPRPATR